MNPTPGWQELLKHPEPGHHLVQIYQDDAFLRDAVAQFVEAGLHAGEAALVIATPANQALAMERLGPLAEHAIRRGQLCLLDAAATLQAIMPAGELDRSPFRRIIGGTIAELRLQFPGVRVHGEMVDLLWRAGRRDAALRLEELWNELGKLQDFSLLCAYPVDPLDAGSYGGPLECLCKAHTHLIPARDYARLDEAVNQASKHVLDQPLAQMLLSLSASHRLPTQMPLGQATLFWLKSNMPRTADKILSRVRQSLVIQPQ
jgi:hypothetical protein